MSWVAIDGVIEAEAVSGGRDVDRHTFGGRRPGTAQSLRAARRLRCNPLAALGCWALESERVAILYAREAPSPSQFVSSPSAAACGGRSGQAKVETRS